VKPAGVIRRWPAGVALACAPMPGLAAADPVEPLEVIQVTATRRPESAFDVPTATNVVDSTAILASAPQTVMDLLHGRAGTYVQQTTPGQGAVIVRGLKGSEVLQLVDGFRLNNAIFRNAPNQYIALVDSQMLGQLEVVRGPMSALHGSDAMGGVVQMLSEEPDFEGDAWSSRGMLRTIYGSADDSTLSRAEAAAGRKGLALSGGGTYQSVGDRRVGGGEVLPYTSYSARAVDLKLRGEVVAGHELMAEVQYSEQPRTPRYDELTPGFGQTQPNSSVFYFEPQRRDFAQLRWRGTDATPLWDNAEAHAGWQVLQDDRRTRDFGSVSEDREKNRDTTWGLTFQAGKKLPDGHFLTWGADYYGDVVDSSRVRTNAETGATTPRPPRFPDGSTMRQFGVFAVDDWTFGRNFDLIAGLRWSFVETQLPPSGGAAGVKVEEDDLSGNLSLSYAVRDDVHLIANLGRGFRAPNVFDLGTFGDRPGNRYNLPNPELSSETVTTLDAGVKVDGERLQGEVFAYVSRYADKITSVLTGEVTPSGRLVVQNRNSSRLDLVGVEAGLRGRLHNGVEWYATATWTQGDETVAGDETPADRIPPIFGAAGLIWDAGAGLQLEAYLEYAGPQDRYSPRDEVDPRIEPGGTAGWVTWNARGAWRATEALSISVRLANLGDRRYREFGSGVDAPGLDCLVTVDYSLGNL
jgi:hemoglobin/transferrin/lactoferrin receptor protein